MLIDEPVAIIEDNTIDRIVYLISSRSFGAQPMMQDDQLKCMKTTKHPRYSTLSILTFPKDITSSFIGCRLGKNAILTFVRD